jgi:hypothetical protein
MGFFGSPSFSYLFNVFALNLYYYFVMDEIFKSGIIGCPPF